MRLLIDGYWWIEGPTSNQLVVRETVLAWLREFPDDEIVLVVPARHVEQARAQLPARVEVAGARLGPHGVAVMLEYPVIAKRRAVDITYAQNFTPTLGPAAVFIHDVLFQSNPEWFTRSERAYFTPIAPLARRAKVVMTSSRAEAARIRRHNPRIARVEAVDLALSTELLQAVPRPPDGFAPDLDFALSVGRLNIRKNLATTLLAAARCSTIDATHPLVVVGEPEGKHAEIPPEVHEAVERGAIRFLGHVDDSELRWLYEHAQFLVFLSLDEGFGLPAVEAAGFGCPVLASDIPVFRETLGECGVFVDPHDLDAVAEALAKAFVTGRVLPGELPEHNWQRTVHAIRAAITSSLAEERSGGPA